MASFRIELEGRDGRRDVALYQTDPAALTHEDGRKFDLSPINKLYVDNHWPERKAFSPQEPIGKSRRVKRLKIQLGLACNYKCSYCSQGAQIGKATSTTNQQAADFIAGLDSWLEGEPEKIELWGGEPLVYWKKIEILAPALRAKFPNTKLLIITNGSLLTAKMIRFIKNLQIAVAVSHDGPGQSLRGLDPFASKTQSAAIHKLFAEIGLNASFNVVMTAENTDMKAIIEFFTAKMGRQVIVNIEDPVSAYEGGTNTLFTPEQFAAMSVNVIKRITDGTALDVPSVLMKLEAFFNGISGGIKLNQCGQWCGMDKEDYLTVDLSGNVVTCQNVGAADHRIGRVEAFDDIKLDTSYHFSKRPMCNGCPVVHLCYGSCMFLTGKEFANSCDNSFHYNLAVIFGGLEILTGKQVVAIDYQNKAKRVIPIVRVDV